MKKRDFTQMRQALLNAVENLGTSFSDLNVPSRQLAGVLMGLGYEQGGDFPRHLKKGVRVSHPKHGRGVITGHDPEDRLSMIVRLDKTFTQFFPRKPPETTVETRYIDLLEKDGWRALSPLELLAECVDG